MASTASTDRSPAASPPGAKPRIDLSCGCSSGCGPAPRAAAPARASAAMPAGAAAPGGSGDDGHAHGQPGDHSGNDHGHGLGPMNRAGGTHDHAHGHDHGEGHAGGHDHDHGTLPGWGRLGVSLAAATAAELLHLLAPDTLPWRAAGMAVAAAAILLAGLGVYRAGLGALARGRLDISALMAVAVTGAFLIGQWPEAAMVMALYALAERIEERAVGRARDSIGALLALSPEQAELRDADGRWRTVPAAEVPLGAVLRLRPGARVPLDGVVLEGRGAVDESSVTGESLAVDKAPGDALYAGTLNAQAELQFRVTAAAGNTTLDRIIHAVEEAQGSRAPMQRFVDRFAAVYTPAVFALAALVAVGAPLALGWAWLDALYRALVLLVIACPCALVIATPVTVVSGLAAGARRGILIKGGQWLERARGVRAVAFDKTGTVTAGRPVLVGSERFGDDGADDVAAALAGRSDHPVSKAIAAGIAPAGTAGNAGGTAGAAALPADLPDVQDFTALPGRGVEGRIHGATWFLGNRRLAQERGLWTDAVEAAAAAHESQGRSVTLLGDAHGVRALFAVADTLRPQAAEAVAELRALGIVPVMLTGDHAAAARAAAQEAGIADVQAGLLPEQKLSAIAALQQQHGMTAMAGDGINDAPALARADIGFAMGAAGTDVAMETADVVIMNDDLRRVAETVRLSRRTHAVLWQNIALALGIKVVFFGLALAGHATMWMAVFADMGASLLVVANGLRMLRGVGSR